MFVQFSYIIAWPFVLLNIFTRVIVKLSERSAIHRTLYVSAYMMTMTKVEWSKSFTIEEPMSMVKSLLTQDQMKYTQANLEDFESKWKLWNILF